MAQPPAPLAADLRLGPGLMVQVLDPTRFHPDQILSVGPLNHPTLPPGGQILKTARQRFVARLPDGLGGQIVLKDFPLTNPASMLRWPKYARAETHNLLHARSLGIRAPVPIALAVLRGGPLRWVQATALVMEDLAGWRDLRVCADDAAALPALAALNRAGVHHADARDENILKAPDGSIALIDWQYAAFPGPFAPGLLEHLAAYYITTARDPAGLMGDWLRGLHEAAGRDRTGVAAFSACVSQLLLRRPRVRDRLARRFVVKD